MGTIQFLQVTPIELAELISESVKSELQGLLQNNQQPSADTKELLTRKATAELLQVSLVTIHEWTNHKLLKQYKLGARTYYKKSEVLEALFNSNNAKK